MHALKLANATAFYAVRVNEPLISYGPKEPERQGTVSAVELGIFESSGDKSSYKSNPNEW